MTQPTPASQPARKPITTTGDLAALLEADLVGPEDLAIFGVAGIDEAGPGELTFIRSPRYANRWKDSRAAATVITRGIEVPGHDPATRALLFVDNADLAMLAMLQAAQDRAPDDKPEPGVHPGAHIAAGVDIPASACIGPGAVVGAGATIGEGVVIGANCSIAAGVTIGAGTRLHPLVSLLAGTRVGRECLIFPGVVLGTDGFGYLPGPEGPAKVPHLGGVVVGDRVEIGANTTVDRGKFGDTVIGDATKIDNQVQIAHACQIGRGVLICGCSALGGSVTIGDGAILAGRVAVRDNVTIAPGAMLGGNSVVDGDIDASEPWFGYPARPLSIARRNYAATQKLGEIWKSVRDLTKRTTAIERHAAAGDQPPADPGMDRGS